MRSVVDRNVVMRQIPALHFVTLDLRLCHLDKAELQPRGTEATSPTPLYCVCRNSCSQALAFTKILHKDSNRMNVCTQI